MRFNHNNLAHKAVLYVPSLKREYNLEAKLLQAVGGMTVTEAVGEYIMETGDVCRERITKLEFFGQDTEETTAAITAYVEYLLESGEESVLLARGNTADLITKEKA